MNLAFALALKSTPEHLTVSGRFKAGNRGRVADLPGHLFEEGAAMRRAGADWASVAEWVRSHGISLADSTIRNEWKRWMVENPCHE